MSVQNSVDRLNAIKARIRTNLVAQGITVPEDTVLEIMAEQILSVAGEDGYTPVKGVDYFTAADKEEIADAVLAAMPGAYSTLRGNVYYGYEFSDCEIETGLVWYYTPSEREGDTIGDITYDCPTAGTGTYGYAIANTTGLALVRNKPIDRIRFRLSPSETATSGVMKFAVMPVNGTTYTHYIEAEFTAENIENSWVTIELDEPFSIGDNETFVIQPVDSTHSASNIGIAVLRASAATTTDEYINLYNTVPNSWKNAGNYITRLGLCVDLGYSKAVKYVPNYDVSSFKGGWNSNNITPNGYVADTGYAKSVIIKKYYVSDDIVTESLIELNKFDAVVAFSSAVRTDGAGGKSVGSLVKYDFANKKMHICKKTDGNTDTDAYVSVDISSVVDAAHKKYIISAGRINSRVFASVSNYSTGATVTKTVEDITVSEFSPVGRFYDYLTFSQLSGSTVYWRDLYTYVPSNVKIAFLGDSITQGIRLPSVSDSWVSQVKKYYGNCVSSGRGGAKADFIIDALNDGLVAAFNPQYVVVTIGTNGDTTPEKLRSIVEKIKEIGSVPIINCVSQTQDGKTTGDEQDISAVNEMIMNLHTLGARFDIATGANNDPYAASLPAIMQDEVHPNANGHALMAERFKFDLKNIKRDESVTVDDVIAALPTWEGGSY